MALDDFAPQGSSPAPALPAAPAAHAAPAKKPFVAEDEDLFDFPVVEMKLELDAEKKRPAVSLHELGASSPTAPVPPTPATPAAAPEASRAAPAAKNGPNDSPANSTAPGKNDSPRKQEQADVAQAAQLVADMGQVLTEEARPRKRKHALRGAPSTTLVMLGVLLVANVAGLLFLWHMSQSFQSSVKAMNEELVRTVHTLHNESAALGASVPNAKPEHGTSTTVAKPEPAPVALEAFEQTALSLAREEIKNGEYGAARRRLARLLAVSDRIEADAREEIEAQAAFLFASTYRIQAEAAREQHP